MSQPSTENLTPFDPERAKSAARVSAAVRRERAAARAAERERAAIERSNAQAQLRALALTILAATEAE